MCKDYTMRDSNYMKFWKKQNYGDSKRIIGCWEVGQRDWMSRWGTVDFQGSENALYDTLMKNICHYTQGLECAPPRVNCNVNCGLWVITKCHGRWINSNKCLTVVGVVDNGAGCASGGPGSVEKISAPSLIFAVNLQLF